LETNVYANEWIFLKLDSVSFFLNDCCYIFCFEFVVLMEISLSLCLK